MSAKFALTLLLLPLGAFVAGPGDGADAPASAIALQAAVRISLPFAIGSSLPGPASR